MIPGKRTFYGVSRKRLLLGVLALLFYGGAVLAFGSMMEEPSVSVFLSGTYPEKEQAEEIVKTLEQTEAETSACFYWDGGLYAELLELSRSHSPEEAEEPTEPTRRIDFDHLQFGKDYEIK